MKREFYKTETQEVDNCVLVFMEDDSSIEEVESIIQSFFFIEKTSIASGVKFSTHNVLKAIYVYPKADITLQLLRSFIKEILQDRELLKRRELMSKHTDVLRAYDSVVLKIFKGNFGQSLIADMHLVWNDIIYHFTKVDSTTPSVLLEAIKKLPGKNNAVEWYRKVYIDSANRETYSPNVEISMLFDATNEFIMRMYK